MREHLQAALPDGFTLHHEVTTESTNLDAAAWAESGQLPQALFIADQQSGGKGRRGRAWQSPPGNLYASLLLPKPEDLRRIGHYGFMISLAIQQTIKVAGSDVPAQVKWPNDVLINGRKCGGILMEVAGEGLIIGFGVNCAHAPDSAAYPVTALKDWINDIKPVEFCASVMQRFFRLRQLAPATLLNEWKANSIGVGEPITVNLPGTQLQGLFIDVADDGALLLGMDDGTRKIYAGDVFFA